MHIHASGKNRGRKLMKAIIGSLQVIGGEKTTVHMKLKILEEI
jgi:hypothetical protein